MQFTDESLDLILDQAGGVSPSTFVPFLRQALSQRDKLRKTMKAAGVTVHAAKSLATKTFYAVGYHCKGGAWKPAGAWEIEGLESVGSAMADAIDATMPGIAYDDMRPQLPAAYVGLSRKGHGHFQQVRSDSEWVDLYVFRSAKEADDFRADFMKDKREASRPVTGLARKT